MQALKLVVAGVEMGAESAAQSPVERVFAHWVFMMGKSTARTALGPARRRVVERALGLYDEGTLLLAIEGCAASAWHAGENDRGRAFNDIELILRDEAHVERFAADGEALRERARREQQARSAAAVREVRASDEAVGEVAREQMRALAERLRGRHRGG